MSGDAFKGISTAGKCKAFARARLGPKTQRLPNRDAAQQQAAAVRPLPVLQAFRPGSQLNGPVPQAGDGVPVFSGTPVVVSVPVPRSRLRELPRPAGPTPSALLRTQPFLNDVALAFPTSREAVGRLSDAELLQQACEVGDAVPHHITRLDDYVRYSQRFSSDEHRKARCWSFMAASFNGIVAIAVAHGHFGFDKDRIAKSQPSESLLPELGLMSAFMEVASGGKDIGALQGAYLHWCMSMRRWIRSGSTSGAADLGFGPRDAEHAKGAELLEEKHLNSDFYVYRTKAASQRCPHLDPPKGTGRSCGSSSPSASDVLKLQTPSVCSRPVSKTCSAR